MTINTITISTIDYIAYATRVQVNSYLAIDPVRGTTWTALTDSDDIRGPFIVAATRRLDLLTWQGEKTGGAAQVNDWPRTGLTYPDGTAVSTTEVPQEVEDATALLSGSIAITAAVADAGSSGSNVKGVKAGSAQVDFFRAQEGKPLQDETAFALIQFWLEGHAVNSSVGPLATDTSGVSTFTDLDQWGRTRGFP